MRFRDLLVFVQFQGGNNSVLYGAFSQTLKVLYYSWWVPSRRGKGGQRRRAAPAESPFQAPKPPPADGFFRISVYLAAHSGAP